MLMKHLSTLFISATLISLIIADFSIASAEPTVPKSKSCVSKPVTARGEPSKFNWIARTKTRANWRQKVRAMTGLGDAYANWKRAENPQEDCTQESNGMVCEFTGIPCKKGL